MLERDTFESFKVWTFLCRHTSLTERQLPPLHFHVTPNFKPALCLKTLELLQEKVASIFFNIAKQQIFFNLILRNSCTILDETS